MPSFPTNINPLSTLLERRHLTAAEGALMGLVITNVKDSSGDLGYVPGGQIKHLEKLPYHDLDGAPIIDPKLNIPFVRYRIERPEGYIPPVSRDLGSDGKPVKPAKYLSPKASSLFVYVPRVDGFNWTNIAANVTVPVIITEGEFKSYSVCKTGNPCLGLMGVQCFGKTPDPFPAPFDQFEHLKREYYIVFDADKEADYENTLKKEVAQAALRLGTKLTLAGGEVFLLHIARTETFRKGREKDPDAKMGIDDFLDAGGTMEEIMSTATAAVSCQDMAELRAKYAYYTGQSPHIINVLNGNIYKVSVFVNELEAPRIRLVPTKSGFKKVSVAEEFKEARDRPEVDRKVFWPNEPSGYDAEGRTYNEWTGFSAVPWSGNREEYNEMVAVWQKFIGGLFPNYGDYFQKWLAHMVQCPGEKTNIAVILASVHNGVGKSLLGEIIRGIVGPTHSIALELDRSMAKFNAQLGKKLFLQMDEADGRFSGHESKLKDLVSADTMVIEPKGFDAYTVDNFLRIFLTSNSSAPIRLDAENRRFFVCGPTMTSVYAKTEWQPWVDSIAKRMKSSRWLQMLHWYLSKVDLTGWDPTARVIVTPQMEEMVEASRSKATTVMDGLWEVFQGDEDGVWLITSETRGKDNKLFADLIEKVRIEGGSTLLYDGFYKGVRFKGTILDREGKLPRKQNTQQKWVLEAGSGFSSEAAWKAGVKATVAYTAWKDNALPGSAKY